KDKFLKIFSNVVGKMNQNSSQSQTIVNNNSQSNDKESGSTEKEPLTSEKEDIPVSSTSTNNVADWAAKINGVLQVGYVWNNYLNRNITPITNGNYTTQYREGRDQGTGRTGLYWCTNLVIDSYQLSGIKGLGAEHQGVVNMRNYWKNAPAPYLYVEYDKADHIQSLSKVSPGCAIFFETVAGVHTGKEHVAIVKSISMDTSKNGLMESYDANTTSRVVKYPIKNGEVKNVPYPLRGFGCLQNSTKVTSVPVPTTTQSSSSQARTQEEAHSLNFLKSCPSDVSQNRTSVQGPPTLTADRLKLILRSMNSPAEAEAQAIYDLGIKYNINPAILMAFFIQESSAGTCKPTCRSIKNKSIGNIRCSQNWTDEGGKCDVGSGNGSFRMYNSWAAGAEDFYKLIRYKYVDQWKLEYVETVIPKYAPSNENNTCGYIKFTVDRIKNSFSSYIK
ncbi:MAG TPA: glucosaminidase domain-containing protein, partial [Candidatus Nitrosocosmicus sp.]|nr:glucosaminidase domain-containing protein [Candidatus Nitrosocosmicus sp.]